MTQNAGLVVIKGTSATAPTETYQVGLISKQLLPVDYITQLRSQ
jgi:hypothetical protein